MELSFCRSLLSFHVLCRRIKVEKTRYCCGGVFYTQFGAEQHLRSTLATSPDYPQPYHLGMECPYIFRSLRNLSRDLNIENSDQ
ncbi:hypothetical protein E2C01_087957 [Portunus trituberculatus]|uniref:CUB domain-containing protein n=1 Tax=Portunus trituberculatus TaxID=210409 RepID=A0A5B7JFF8_PORTR|nr:hypothetical protein [Portunus trituberculatus]